MTREELKEHCKKQIEMCEMWAKAKGESPCGKVYEEHKMILELLEQEPCEDWCNVLSDKMTLEQTRQAVKDLRKKLAECLWQEPCEDCVSRQAVLDMATTIWTDDYSDNQIMDVVDVDDIKALPSVTPQPKIGRWILTQRYNYVDINCSECGSTRIKDYAYGYTVDELNLEEINDFIARTRMNYCECCGAKMEEVKE